MTRYVAAVLLAGSIGLARAEQPLRDDFDALNWSTWCPCQIKMDDAPIRFHPDVGQTGNRVVRITVDEASIGGNDCLSDKPERECRIPRRESGVAAPDTDEDIDAVPDMPEPLGPSLVSRGVVEVAARSQELRFQTRHRHDATKPYRYVFRFRMPHSVEDRTRSIRWVIAQWKHSPVSDEYKQDFGDKWGPSPYLANRFDNGVLHVTVQDEHCRCKVASAPYPDGTNPKWEDGVPPYCESTRDDDPPGTSCTPPPALRVEYGSDPALSSPLGNWVEMSYRVQASRTGNAFIEVYDGGRFIVRVTGRIGYKPKARDETRTKFKIGQYRDFMPFVHEMDIDWLEVRPLPN